VLTYSWVYTIWMVATIRKQKEIRNIDHAADTCERAISKIRCRRSPHCRVRALTRGQQLHAVAWSWVKQADHHKFAFEANRKPAYYLLPDATQAAMESYHESLLHGFRNTREPQKVSCKCYALYIWYVPREGTGSCEQFRRMLSTSGFQRSPCSRNQSCHMCHGQSHRSGHSKIGFYSSSELSTSGGLNPISFIMLKTGPGPPNPASSEFNRLVSR
jgi:hypothetical protein